MKYRKKPVVIDAFQLPALEDDNMDPFFAWCEEVGFDNFTSERDGTMAIETLEGTMTASPGDYIIKGVAGEFYPCRADIFDKTYERVN